MGREVRMVPANWQHPKAYNYRTGKTDYVPLYEGGFGGGYSSLSKEWDEGWEKWQQGLRESYGKGPKWVPIEEEYKNRRYTDYSGQRPSPDDFMPDWPNDQRTHLMMYEDTSEGTPISPAFDTPEKLARWLCDNEASSCGRTTASFDSWLGMINVGWAPSMVVSGGRLKSGVEASPTIPDQSPQGGD